MQCPGRVCRDILALVCPFLVHISSLFQSKIKLYMVRILVGAHIAPNEPFARNNAESVKGGLSLVKVANRLRLV